MPNFLDLFAGAGGLSEGFIQAGYTPLAHIEMDAAACYTLRTRAAYHWLKRNNDLDTYMRYLQDGISREDFYNHIPKYILDAVLNYEINENNLPEIFEKVDALLNEQHQLDLIIGGPPCQAYSLVGRARSDNSMMGDQRNYLYKLYAEFLKRYRPKYFVFENVVGLISAKDRDGSCHFSNMQDLFRSCGYSVKYSVLNAKDYGVLQNRKRIILIGKLGNSDFGYPVIPKVYYPDVIVSEIFQDLPVLHAGEGTYKPVRTRHYTGRYLYDMKIKEFDQETVSFHIARPHTEQDLKIYELVVKMWNQEQKRIEYPSLPKSLRTHRNVTAFLDRFKVVAGELPYSQTVVAHIAKDGHYYIHPDLEQNRSLTPREAARLQTFPDNYYFESKLGIPGRTQAYKQIGNAVPVRLAYAVAKSLLDVL